MSGLTRELGTLRCKAGLHPQVVASGCALCNWERALQLAVDAIAVAHPGIDAQVACAAVIRSASTTPNRGVIARYLAAHPLALVSGESGAPGPVRRLIGELRA